jgi:hypothetical protein
MFKISSPVQGLRTLIAVAAGKLNANAAHTDILPTRSRFRLSHFTTKRYQKWHAVHSDLATEIENMKEIISPA